MTSPLRVLIIEDDSSTAATVKERLDEITPSLTTKVQSFNGALEEITTFQPDAVVLDLLEGTVDSGNLAGNLTWQNIWTERFAPLIVYTASTQQTSPPLPENHPFIRRVRKGEANSIMTVLSEMTKFLPYMQAVRATTLQLNKTLHRVLTETAPALWKDDLTDDDRKNLFSRVLHRRVAASADEPIADAGSKLIHWEQYIFPPLSSDLLTGDILRKADQPWNSPEAHVVILTPSCDLVRRDGQPKSAKFLAASCVGIQAVWDKCSICNPSSTANETKAADQLTRLITSPQLEAGLMLLPPFPGLLPNMAVALKSLQLIDYEDVKGMSTRTTHAYERIVSVDSPFREAIVWTYLQVACRPGLPDRHTDTWASSLINDKKAAPAARTTPV